MRFRGKHLGAVALTTALLGLGACTSSTSSTGSAGTSRPGGTTPSGQGVTSIPGLPPAALDVMNKPPYAGGFWAVSVADAKTGETLIAYNDDKLLEPASVTKTYSAGAMWLAFGPDRKLTTPVKRRGEVVGGTLQGDLVLVGQGDLTMGGRTKPDGTVDFTNLDHNDANPLPGATLTPEDPLTGIDELARQVKASGIDTVTGQVVVDDRLWQPHELQGEPISPIVINNNLIDLTSTPTSPGQLATVEMRPKVSPWTVTTEVKTVEAGGRTGIKVSSPAPGQILLTGTVAADAGPTLNVYAFEDPATFARTALVEALGRAGVKVTADPVATNSTAGLPAFADVTALPSVAGLESLPLEEDVTYTMKISYNRGAETFVCLLAVHAGSTDCDDGWPKINELWTKAGLDPKGAALIDGSGLPGNYIKPANQTALQRIMAQRPDADRWKATMPILGVDGSLAMVQPDGPAKGKVLAKTGTLGGGDLLNNRLRVETKALGGFIEAKSGRQLVFCIIGTNGMFDDIQGVFAANDDVGKIAELIQQAY